MIKNTMLFATFIGEGTPIEDVIENIERIKRDANIIGAVLKAEFAVDLRFITESNSLEIEGIKKEVK